MLIECQPRAENSATLPLICSCRPPRLLGTFNAMCDPFQSLRSAVRSFFIKRNDSNTEPTGDISDANVPENGPIGALSKGTEETMEYRLSCFDEMIQNEMSNPRRRENMQLCRDFARDNGWPNENYCILALKGVVLVLTEQQLVKLPKSPFRRDAFTLVSRYKPVLFSCVLFPRPFLMVTIERTYHGSTHGHVVLEAAGPICVTVPEQKRY